MVPEKVRIGGVDYHIKYDPSLNDGRNVLMGEIQYSTGQIRLNNTDCNAYQVMELTLWHEIVHGIFRHFGKENWNDDEELVETVARGVYMVLQDNPTLGGFNA